MDASGSVQEIRYVCVARRPENVVIAQRVHTPAKTSNFYQNVKRVLDSPGWANITSDKLTLDDGENTFYVLIDDQGRAFIAVASKSYPARHIYDSNDGRTEGFLGGEWHSGLFVCGGVFAPPAAESHLVATDYSIHMSILAVPMVTDCTVCC